MLAGAGINRQHEHEAHGQARALGAEENALVSFMQTLTDGFTSPDQR